MAEVTYLYRLAACCDSRQSAYFQSTTSFVTGTFEYTGTTYTDPITEIEFVNGNCYQIQNLGVGAASSGALLPDTADLSRIVDGNCFTEPCPCASSERYLIFQKCCDNSLIYFKSTEDGNYFLGLKEYIGAPNYILDNVCYRVDIVSVGIGPILDNTMWNSLPLAPNAINFTGPNDPLKNCDDPAGTKECPSCPERCFLLSNCDGDHIYTNTNLSLYLGQVINISDQDYNSIPGDWFVTQTDAPCAPESYFSSLQVTASGITVDCKCYCYEITGNPISVTYFDCDQVLHETSGSGSYCSLIPPIVIGGNQGMVTQLGECVDGVCPEFCYKFTNCITSEEIVVSNSSTITPYFVEGKTVTIMGYDGCWVISKAEDCACAISVTVLQAYDDCKTCLPTIAYKFTNCNNQLLIKYSTDDYSDYIGKTVELDCGECWFVDQINYNPPSTQTTTIVYTYDSCLACNRKYYLLTSCDDPEYTIITYSDLSGYLNQIVNLLDCDGCFIVSETRESTNASIVNVIASFDTCELCAPVPPTPDPVVYPKRKVKPGYSTPTCDPDQYEKITCKSSEIYYKQVMRLRYGISNCCPEDEEKWLVKKELIDLAALRDPDYICKPVTTCCGEPIQTCGCGCNQTLKTCNSQ